MPIQTENNQSYGGPEGYNKYSPLNKLKLAIANQTECDNLVKGRTNFLDASNIFPAALELYTDDWNAIAASEFTAAAGANDPPIVVVSSNRSTYIKAGVIAADANLATLGMATYNNLADVRSLLATSTTMSPPIYLPVRLGPNPRRNVYVIVHEFEYKTYQNALAGTGMTVIGWRFTHGWLTFYPTLTGFGATRYAAIEFCKELWRRTTAIPVNPVRDKAPWDKAWIFDDNVVAFALGAAKNLGAGLPTLLAQAEAKMTPTVAVAGFRGLTIPKSKAANQLWAFNLNPEQANGNIKAKLPDPIFTGLIQQAALWNIEYLMTNSINFSPIFIASKEDVSLCRYFDQQSIAYQYYKDVYIIKEIVLPNMHDASVVDATIRAGAQQTITTRQAWETQFSNIENNTLIQPPNGPPDNLLPFIDKVVLPPTKLSPTSQNLSRGVCCAVEQIITQAIFTLVAPVTVPPFNTVLSNSEINAMFRILHTNLQTITATNQ